MKIKKFIPVFLMIILAINVICGSEALAQISAYANKQISAPKVKPTGTIKIFGDLNFEDSFYDVLLKINSIPGVEKITLSATNINNIAELKGITQKSTVSIMLQQLITSQRSKSPLYNFSNPSSSNMYRMYTYDYLDLQGKKKYYYLENFTIQASPIVINGVPFKLEIEFGQDPGIAILKPQNVLNPGIYSFPLVINKINLYSDAVSLNYKKKELDNMLAEKYKDYVDYFCGGVKELSEYGCAVNRALQDDYGNIVTISPDSSFYCINFVNPTFGSKLSEIYRKHLNNLEAQKYANPKNNLSF